MSPAVALLLIAIVSYFIGTINFSRIIAWYGHRKEITKLGSGNPGTMNMLRNFGFVTAFFTLIAEVVKAGLTCYVVKIIMQGSGYAELAFYFAGFFVVLGNDYPCYYGFRGGKGVACTGGMFMFSELWWLGLILFAVGVILIVSTEYGFLSSLTYIIGMSIGVTVNSFLTHIPFAWAITAIVWALAALSVFKHRGNIYRLAHGKENRANFKAAFMKMIRRKKDVQIEGVASEPEHEIIIEDTQAEQTEQGTVQAEAAEQENGQAESADSQAEPKTEQNPEQMTEPQVENESKQNKPEPKE